MLTQRLEHLAMDTLNITYRDQAIWHMHNIIQWKLGIYSGHSGIAGRHGKIGIEGMGVIVLKGPDVYNNIWQTQV